MDPMAILMACGSERQMKRCRTIAVSMAANIAQEKDDGKNQRIPSIIYCRLFVRSTKLPLEAILHVHQVPAVLYLQHLIAP